MGVRAGSREACVVSFKENGKVSFVAESREVAEEILRQSYSCNQEDYQLESWAVWEKSA